MTAAETRIERFREFMRAHKGCTSCLYPGYVGGPDPVLLTAQDYADGKCPLTMEPDDRIESKTAKTFSPDELITSKDTGLWLLPDLEPL